MEAEKPTARLTLHKGEKLRHRTLVEHLFSEGETLYDWPLRVTVRKLGAENLESEFRMEPPGGIGALQMLITVPKKKIRHAVERVLLRRRIREAYRLHRNPLKEAVIRNRDTRTLSIAFIYIGTYPVKYALIEKKMIRLLDRIKAGIAPEEGNQCITTADKNEAQE